MNIIKDKSLEPYCIHMDDHNYMAVLPSGKLDKHGNEHYRTFGYYSTLGGAVRRIVRLKSASKEDTLTLSGYIDRIESVGKEILDRLSI